MTPAQREAALRLADWLHASGVVNSEVKETIALLRELAAERERKPLTEEQISNRAWACYMDLSLQAEETRHKLLAFARLIEAAHGIKEAA